jgi:DnaK suppressor protein
MDTLAKMKLKKALLKERERILNNSKESIQSKEFAISADDLADETDLAATEVSQHLAFQMRDRDRSLLGEIDDALSRMENGTYGICEETDEEIELDRLEAIPWTRLSLAGAELRENRKKRFARL